MAFTVEDGSGVSGANSYVSVADADTYHADRSNSGWTGTDAVKQAALIEATDYVESRYRWATGVKSSSGNGLGWPRSGAVDVYGHNIGAATVPEKVKQAVSYLALKALSADLNASLDRAKKRTKVDAIEVEYVEFSEQSTRYPYVDGLLSGLVDGLTSVPVELV